MALTPHPSFADDPQTDPLHHVSYCRRTAPPSLPQPLAARVSPRRLLRMGRCRQFARRRLRPWRRAQRSRLRCARRGDCSYPPCARRRHARPRRERLARRSERLHVRDLSDDADGADRTERRRDGRLGGNVDGRSPRNRNGGAAEDTDCAGRDQRRRSRDRAGGARADSRLFRSRSDICDVRGDRAVHSQRVGAVRSADRCAMGNM